MLWFPVFRKSCAKHEHIFFYITILLIYIENYEITENICEQLAYSKWLRQIKLS